MDPVSKWLRSNGVRELRLSGVTGEFIVLLNCGGPAGYGETAPKALKQAREKNAEFLQVAA